MTDDRTRRRAERLTIRRYATTADADRHDLAFWHQIPTAERIRLVWRLSVEQWQLSGAQVHEPGLRRSLTRIRGR